MEHLEALIDQRAEFLKENPHLISYQNDIDKTLSGRSPEQRCRLLESIMLGNLRTMISKLEQLRTKVKIIP